LDPDPQQSRMTCINSADSNEKNLGSAILLANKVLLLFSKRIFRERKNQFRLTYLDKVVFDHVEAHFLVLGGPVLGQGVVHIEPIELDLLQGQRSIHEDSNRDKWFNNYRTRWKISRKRADQKAFWTCY
jgi:hypothetical protein